MAENLIKIVSKGAGIEYYYWNNDYWYDLSENNHSTLNREDLLLAGINEKKASDIYEIVLGDYNADIEIEFVGTQAEYDILASVKKNVLFADIVLKFVEEKSSLDDELENICEEVVSDKKEILQEESDELLVAGDSEEDREYIFIVEDLYNLQTIMKNHGVVKDDVGYRELTKEHFAVAPDAYLGRDAYHSIYYTVAGIYAKTTNGTWLEVVYDELCLEDMKIREKDGQFELDITDVNGTSFSYVADETAYENFKNLLQELKNSNTAEFDEYSSIWKDEIPLYCYILIDFLKLGKHKTTIAALQKCSYFGLDDENGEGSSVFREICEYGLSDSDVSIDALKKKVLEWETMLEPHLLKLSVGLLLKDLVETLQLANGEPTEMIPVEREFVVWVAEQAGIEELNKFLEMIRLPYCLISEKGQEHITVEKLVEIEKYAYQQNHIPFSILDNEKMGLWSSLYDLSKEITYQKNKKSSLSEKIRNYFINDYLINDYLFKVPDKVDLLLDQSRWITYFDFCASMSCFVMEISFLEEELIMDELIGDFLGKCGLSDYFLEIVVNEVYACFTDENWNNALVKYFDDEDRRTLGKEMVNSFFLEKSYRIKKASIRAKRRYNIKFQALRDNVTELKENISSADKENKSGKNLEKYRNAVDILIETHEKEIEKIEQNKERTYTNFEYKKVVANALVELGQERFSFISISDIRFMIGDITGLNVDCIVNATNSLLSRSGVSGAIYNAAGNELLEECKRLKECNVGEARITKGYKLNAKHIIHTVGPRYDASKKAITDLENCYTNCLNLAKQKGIHTIAFPAISTGYKKYPVDKACEIALRTVMAWQERNSNYPMFVILCSYDDDTYVAYRNAVDNMYAEAMKNVAKELGFQKIEKCCEVVKDGEKGLLVWDYAIWNEISFFSYEHRKRESLFKELSDIKTEKEYQRLVQKYAIRKRK